MRKLVGLFGGFCCAVVIALVARFAFKTADNDIDAYINAFMYATIAAGGLGGHAVALRVWKRSWIWGVLIGLISAVALMVNISNSLGAIAGRGDAKAAERLKQTQLVRDLRKDLDRLSRERDNLGTFQMTSADAVKAARDEVDAAAKRAEVDCARGYNTCQKLKDAETVKRSAYTKLTSERATTERADRLDTELKELREKLAKVQPVQSGNAQATALSRLFGMGDGEQNAIIYFQYLAVSIVVELLIVGALVGHELMGDPPAVPITNAAGAATGQKADKRKEETVQPLRTTTAVPPGKMRELPPPRPKESPTPLAPVVRTPPIVIETKPAVPARRVAGDIAAFAVERLSPSEGGAVPLEAVYADYSAWCEGREEMAASRADFERWFRTIGKEIGITIIVRGTNMLCRNVTLAA